MKNLINSASRLSIFVLRASWLLILPLIWLGPVVDSGQAANGDPIVVEVNSFEDVKKGNDGACSLREAIIAANTDKGSGGKPGECKADDGTHTIILKPGTYALTRTDNGKEDSSQTGDLDVIDNLTILVEGPGATIDGTGITDRVFHILSGDVTITGLTIHNPGQDDWFEIYNPME